MINEAKLEEIMLELGHPEHLAGTDLLRQAVVLYEGGTRQMSNEVYPALAAAANTSTMAIERNMRHSLERAWSRGSLDAQYRYFGHSINPVTGRPTLGEYVARLARICHEN